MLPRLELIGEPKELNELIGGFIRGHGRRVGELRILEAGCGRRWPFRLDDVRYTLTGIDADQAALESRQRVRKDLDEAILGDLRTVQLPQNQFDIIYSAFLLEHVDGAETVLRNFLRWLKPGGLLILTFPDRSSAFGFCTRIAPFWMHVLYKKYMVGRPNAGRPGFGPYPTHYDEIIARQSFHQFLNANALAILAERGFGTLPPLQRLITKLVTIASLGRLASGHRNLVYVLERVST